MSAQPEHETFKKPFWQVQGVFDPDGQEPDFSYTIGLHGRGIPELHVWAQPDQGDDPGADWRLSMNDRCRLLNEFAGLALCGRLGVGSEFERRYDAGRTILRFRVGPAGDREVLEAYGIAPDAIVLPVHWSLHRAPEGPRGAMASEPERAAASAYHEIRAGLCTGRRAPRGWTLPRTPSFAADQRFGPRTPVVLARAAQLWQAGDEVVADLLQAALLVESSGMSLTYPAAVAAALAREVGRSRCLADLRVDVNDLVDRLTCRPAAAARWRRVVRTFDAGGWTVLVPAERDRMVRGCAGLLRDLLGSCLSYEVVADVVDDDLWLSALGPWLSGLRGGAPVPGAGWFAGPDVLAVVADLLAPLDAESLGVVAGIHQIAMTRGITEAPGYAELCQRLSGWALVSAAGCPWEATLLSLPAWRPLFDAVPQAVVAPLAPLQEWATCLSSALTHRWRLSNDEVRTLAAPFRQDLPLLERRLNEPV
jgi:hypothetical protein